MCSHVPFTHFLKETRINDRNFTVNWEILNKNDAAIKQKELSDWNIDLKKKLLKDNIQDSRFRGSIHQNETFRSVVETNKYTLLYIDNLTTVDTTINRCEPVNSDVTAKITRCASLWDNIKNYWFFNSDSSIITILIFIVVLAAILDYCR